MINLVTFYDVTNGMVDEGRAVDIVYPDFSKAFSTASHKVLTDQLMRYNPGQWTAQRVDNQLNCQAQRVLISGTKSSCSPVNSYAPQETLMGPILFNVFINGLDDGRERTLSTFADDTKLQEVANTPNGIAAIRGTSTGWRNRSTRISWSSTKGNTTRHSCRAPGLQNPWHLHPIQWDEMFNSYYFFLEDLRRQLSKH